MDSKKLFEQYEQLKTYIEWRSDDVERVVDIGPLIKPEFPAIIADFYQQIRRTPEAFRVIRGGSEQIARLQHSLRIWLDDLFQGVYDESYIQRRWKIACRHVEIGLAQTYVNAAVSRLRCGLSGALTKHWNGLPERLPNYLRSLHRLLDLEAAILDAAYQAEFNRRDQQVQRMAMLGQISGGIAHELRNPLNVVKTSVYYLLNAKNPSAEKSIEHLQRIERQVNLASDVISAISEFAKIGMPTFENFSLRDHLKEWVENHCCNPNVSWEADLQGSGQILGDPRQLQIVVGNMVRNACEAMPSGGLLKVTLREDTENEFVSLQIEDDGHGIPAETISRITDPWFSTKARGAGLGLAISKAILDRHKANMQIFSELEKGTRFVITFPRISTP